MPPDPSAADLYGRDFPAGAVVLEEGDPAIRMYVVVAGEVRIPQRVGARVLALAALGPGEASRALADHVAPKRRFEPEESGRNPP